MGNGISPHFFAFFWEVKYDRKLLNPFQRKSVLSIYELYPLRPHAIAGKVPYQAFNWTLIRMLHLLSSQKGLGLQFSTYLSMTWSHHVGLKNSLACFMETSSFPIHTRLLSITLKTPRNIIQLVVPKLMARKHQCMTAITTMWTESLWAFPESYTAWLCAQAMADNGELITPPPRWVSAQLLYVCVTTWQRSRGCSQILCSPFLWAVRLFI